MARRDYYDPITAAWISERDLLARVAKYQVAAERAAERVDYLASELVEGRTTRGRVRAVERRLAAYEAALDALEIQTDVLGEEPEPSRLAPSLRGYEYEARRLVRHWMLEDEDTSIEWEFGDDYE